MGYQHNFKINFFLFSLFSKNYDPFLREDAVVRLKLEEKRGKYFSACWLVYPSCFQLLQSLERLMYFSKLPHPIQATQFLPEWCHNLWSLLASFFKQGSPASEPWAGTSCQIIGNIRLEIKCTTNVMRLSYPQTIPSHSVHGKTVFH